jgi:hypothetical protein
MAFFLSDRKIFPIEAIQNLGAYDVWTIRTGVPTEKKKTAETAKYP